MPRPSLTSSFALSDASNEVVCPLKNNDGSNCRKRCLGEKRFRSMQEHIRRAHPSHYIPKLPATEESFMLMVNSQRPDDPSPRPIDEAHPAATAAVALAQLHHHRLASDWGDDNHDHAASQERMRSSVELPPLRDHFKHENFASASSPRPRELLPSILARSPPPRSSTLPPIQRRDRFARPRKSSITQNARKPKHEPTSRPQSSRDYPHAHHHHHHLHPHHHPRRPSLGERKALSAEPQTAAWAQGKRWEDLIEAATSATEVDDDRSVDAAPLPPLIANITSAPFDQQTQNRASLPPLHPSHNRSLPPPYTASPLHKSLTPPPFDSRLRGRDSDLEPFPSIESSLDSASSASGKHFPVSRNLAPSVHSDSSPMYPPPSQQRPPHRFSNPNPVSGPGTRNREIHISCANCARPSALDDCFACTECICGVCRDCLGFVSGSPSLQFAGSPRQPQPALNGLFGGPGSGGSGGGGGGGPTSHPQTSPGQASAASVASSNSPGRCPRCRTVGGKWKAFQLEVR